MEPFLMRHPPLRFGASLLRKHCGSKTPKNFTQIRIAPYALFGMGAWFLRVFS